MRLELTDDEEFFRETTGRFLDEYATPAELRRLRDDPVGFAEKYWHGGADLGWTSLLVAEAAGGGTISGNGLSDLGMVAYEFGRRAAPGPLIATSVAAASISDTALVEDVLAGRAIVTCAPGQTLEIDDAGDGGLVVRGTLRPVESAAQARAFLVTDGRLQAVVPADAAGVRVTPMGTIDLTRRFGVVTFDDVRVDAGSVAGAALAPQQQLRVAIALACAESVGAMQAGFDMTLEWMFDRYSFGRPLASYQALKHRFADMKYWLETAHAVSDAALAAVAADGPDAADMVSAAKAFIGQYGSELLHECVQLHGGLGVTFEHDIHFFVRRQALNRSLYGTPAEHRRLLAQAVLA